MPSYVVEIDTWMRDTSRVDAWQMRLRVWRDGTYYQFFTVVVPGIDLAAEVSNRDQEFQTRFWRWLGKLAVDPIRQACESGQAPLPDPNTAIELRGDVRRAVANARSGADPGVEQSADHRDIVGRFTLPS